MIGWLVGHFSGPIGSALFGVLGHFGTQAVGFIRDRQNLQSLKQLAEIKASASVASASYQAAKDWIHPALVGVLLMLYVTAAWKEAPDDLVSQLSHWTGFGIGWLFPRLWTR